MTLGIVSFQLVMWGVYKARENIHHCVADQLLLTISASCRRDATYNPNFISFTPSSNLSRMFYWNKDTQILERCDYIDLYEFNTLDCNPPFEDLWDTLLFYSPLDIDFVLFFSLLIFLCVMTCSFAFSSWLQFDKINLKSSIQLCRELTSTSCNHDVSL